MNLGWLFDALLSRLLYHVRCSTTDEQFSHKSNNWRFNGRYVTPDETIRLKKRKMEPHCSEINYQSLARPFVNSCLAVIRLLQQFCLMFFA